MLRLHLLGELAVEVDGERLAPPESRRVRSLLAWLALHPGLHSRGELAGRFWPDVLDASARTSLRTALVGLRRALGPAADRLHGGRDTVGLLDDGELWVDAIELERRIERGELEEALELAGGELLAGLDDEWVYEARDEHRERLAELFSRLAAGAQEAGDLPRAVELSRRLLALDPLSEQSARALVERLAAAGDRPAALNVYERLRERLRRDLGLAPSAETRALVERVRSGDEPAPAAPPQPANAAPAPAAPEQPARAPLPGPVHRTPERPLVGREAELDRLAEAWERAGNGERLLVGLAGDAGIGKTSLAGELARRAHAEGADVLLGRCYEESLAPYGPFGEAVRRYVGEAGPEALAGRVGRWAGELARLAPAVADRLGDVEPAVTGDPEGDRFRLFEAVSALVAGPSPQPTVLVLEDLHWADRPTLLLLRHLMRAPEPAPLLVLGTWRDTEVDPAHPLTEALADLRRDVAVETIALGGLDRHSVRELIADVMGGAPPATLVSAVHRETEGNPFFVGEVLRHLDESAGHPERTVSLRTHERQGLPEGVKDVIGRRLARLSEPSNRALAIAAVIGREFDFDLLLALTGLDEDALLESLEEAIAVHVIDEDAAPGRFSFAHALTRETLYEGLSATRRRRLHARIGAELERQAGGDLDRHVGELARHFVAAADPSTAAKAAAYARLAAQRAMSLLAYEEAADRYEDALRVVTGSDVGGPEVELNLLLALGDAEARAGAAEASRATYERAAEAARALGSAEQLAHAALGFAGPRMNKYGVVDDDEIALLEEALERVGAENGPLRARLLARLAEGFYLSGDVERIDRLSREALALAREHGDPTALSAALTSRLYAAWVPGKAAARARVGRELLAHAEASGDAEAAAHARAWLIAAHVELGQMEEADRQIEAYAELAAALRRPLHEQYLAGYRAMRALVAGGLEEGERQALHALTISQREAAPDTAQNYGVHLLTMRSEQGRLGELVDGIQGFVDLYPRIPGWKGALAWAHAQTGGRERARELLDELMAGGENALPWDANWMPAMALWALAVSRLGDRAAAATLYERLRPFGGDVVVLGWGSAAMGTVHRYLGLLAAAAGRREEAVAHLEAAVTQSGAMGAAVWLSRARQELAMVLAGDPDPERRREAEELLAEASATAERLGLAGFHESAVTPV